MPKTEENIETTSNFVREVAKYFMNFLETDFKRRRIPKRNSIKKTLNGLKVGINLEKYIKLKAVLTKNLNKGFDKEKINIKKGDYTTNIPKSLLDLIAKKIESITGEDLKKVFKEIVEKSEENATLYAKQYDKFLEETKEKSKDIISKILILPFLDELDKPLENLELADENSKYQLQIEIVDSLFSIFESKLTEILQKYFHKKQKDSLKKELGEIITPGEVKKTLSKFFDNFAISDAYYDIYQLFRNNRVIDKTELYIYFYEIGLGNEIFPVLYLPISVEKEENKFVLKFEKRIFVNTKAIDFIVQEFNMDTAKKATLIGEFERIIYLNGEEKFQPMLEDMIRKLEDFFELNRNINTENEEFQKGVNLITSLSNRHYIYLFDKSDEALINDYEDILDDSEGLLGNFALLLNDFIEENPTAYMDETEDEWDSKDIPQKLIVESPIPLNDEQKQVLMALNRPGCRFTVLEGPPGTGKSHTITAIICRALLEEKSVLVLSDKKEALDVVEDKISQTLNKIRHEDDFQNPILRLGKAGNKFYKIVQGQTISKIKEHYRAYKHKKDEYDQARNDSVKDLEKNIKENIEYFKNISLEDIEFYFNNDEKHKKLNWILDENATQFTETFPKIKRIIEKLRTQKNCDFKITFITKENLQALDDLKSIYTDLENKKRKIERLDDYKGRLSEFGNLDKEKRKKIYGNLIKIIESSEAIDDSLKDLGKMPFKKIKKETSLNEITKNYETFKEIAEIHEDAQKFFSPYLKAIKTIEHFVVPNDVKISKAISELKKYMDDIKDLKNPIFRYAFKKEKINNLNRELKKTFNFFALTAPEKHIKEILSIYDLYEFINSKFKNPKESENMFREVVNVLVRYNSKEEDIKEKLENFYRKTIEIQKEIKEVEEFNIGTIEDLEKFITLIEIINLGKEAKTLHENIVGKEDLNLEMSDAYFQTKDLENDINYIDQAIKAVKKVQEIEEDVMYLEKFEQDYPQIAESISLNTENSNINELNCVLIEHPDKEILDYLKFKQIEQKLEEQFRNQPKDTYYNAVREIEDLVTAQMTYFLDKRIIEYSQNFASEVNTLKNIIRKKQKFPKGLFKNLKKAFPCILAGIRDYAEFIPLEKDLFDLIVIDEASQVSIAQALPALIRGKQVVVMGDDKQFSNVKANNASKVTNQEFRKKIQSTFKKDKDLKEDKFGWLTKVKENFDIKNSILKFMKFIRNYECQLKKHFRCYPEIISYSDKHFYDNTLQCMKVRGKPIEEVIKIDVIEHDGKFDETKNTNELEADYIIKKLKEFKAKGIEQSIGIITPHREQVSLLFDGINNMEERDWLFGKCKLKIMTFDTCQGEEKDYVFYSMVATKEKDRLNWIFLKDFKTREDEVEGTIRAQRLNVGFSRAKECIHFVLSKDPEKFDGEIKNALIHYSNELKNGKKQIFGGTDEKSPMEDKIQKLFYQTNFYKEYKEKIEFIPQFPIGEYLRQLDKDYKHPAYKVDFLLIHEDNKIVIEYDGFKEHFEEREEVNISNYEHYLKADDIYRQKILEGYGYRFLRINKFNLGKDPVNTLDERIKELVKKN